MPFDLVAVGDPATLIVALGAHGILRRTPDGDWQTQGAGPVPELELPRVFEVAESPLLGAAWLAAISLGFFGLSLLWQASPESETATARPWWIGFVPLTVGVAYIPLVAVATGDYPYGLLGDIADPLMFWLAAPLALILSAKIAGRHSEAGVVSRASMTTIRGTFAAVVIMAILLFVPLGYLGG